MSYFGALIFGVLWWTGAYSHQAPLGWNYDATCCSGVDCRQVADDAVLEKSDGYHIAATGEVIPYNDKRIHDSKDEFFHWCSYGGLPTSKTICLYRAPRGF